MTNSDTATEILTLGARWAQAEQNADTGLLGEIATADFRPVPRHPRLCAGPGAVAARQSSPQPGGAPRPPCRDGSALAAPTTRSDSAACRPAERRRLRALLATMRSSQSRRGAPAREPGSAR